MITKIKATKYKICIMTKVGPFKTTAQAVAAKKAIKAKVTRATCSAVTGKTGAYYCTVKRTYIKSIPASARVVKEAVRRSAPNSTITVTKA
jgi:uncharacterized membrane protein YfbV (UPF0208 family)